MTYVKDPFGRDLFVNFDKVWVGFEEKIDRISKVRNELSKTTYNYPPYNIVKTSESTYAVEIAVAGFSKEDIDIELESDKITIKGNVKNESITAETSYLYRGISNRAFTRTFELDDFIEVKGAQLVDGMLRVVLERVIPESKKPKKITIQGKDQLPSSSKQLLVD